MPLESPKEIAQKLNTLDIIFNLCIGIPLIAFLFVYLNYKDELVWQFLMGEKLVFDATITIGLGLAAWAAENKFQRDRAAIADDLSLEEKLNHFLKSP